MAYGALGMIRRDYILGMIQDFCEALARLNRLKAGQKWSEASATLDEQFERLAGAGPQAVARLSETELLASLLRGEPTQVVHEKTLMLTTLLKEAGDLAAARQEEQESRVCYLKGLHLLLDTLASEDVAEFPDFVPRVEVFVQALNDAPLPLTTQGLLMQHYERTGQFGKAEDALFAMLAAAPEEPGLVDFGLRFYQRLQALPDATLAEGNLPRPELQAGLAELRSKRLELET